MAQIERKYMAHYLDASTTETPTYELLGADLEEYTIEMNANVETKQNILGASSTFISGYEPQASVEPYIADKDTQLFKRLQTIIDERQALDKLKSTAVEVHLWETTEGAKIYPAYREDVLIEPVSYGGDTTAYQIPFNLHYVGNRTKGTFNVETKTFTPATTA